MRKTGRLLALLFGLLPLCTSPAAAAVDMTGRWRLDFSRFGSPLISRLVDFAQTGSAVVGDFVPPDGLPEYAGFAFFGSAFGAFSLTGPPSCGESRLSGTLAPDGNTLAGIQDAFMFFDMPPVGCIDLQLDVTGVRIGTITPVCGNGVIEVPEQCDDGNVTAGDGCGTDCRVEACSYCSGLPSICIPVACGLCESSPRIGCRTAPATGKVTLALKNAPAADGDRLTWSWSKGETPLAQFGDPVHLEDYALCVYDRSGPAPVRLLGASAHAGVPCGDKPCWKATGLTAFRYQDRTASSSGVQSIRLKAGSAGHAAIRVKARGSALILPGLPVAEPVTLTVQLQAASGACWQADYDAAGVVANDASQLRARPQ